MVKVSVFYPNLPGSHFDMSYYCSKHITMVQRLLGPVLKNVAVEEGSRAVSRARSSLFRVGRILSAGVGAPRGANC